MLRSFLLRSIALLAFTAAASAEEPAKPASRLYELRTYHAEPGKLNALNARFREHTTALFTKHGMTNVGYWVPKDNADNLLIYLLSFPDREARDKAWKEFGADPEWKTVQATSEAKGKIVGKIESRFLTATDFSPEPKGAAEGTPHLFELRTYTATPNNLPLLLSRFREHTLKLFERHGMTNFLYTTPVAGDPGADNTLVYLLQHASAEAQVKSWADFRADPEWVKIKADSDKAGGGSLTVLPDGVKSVLLVPTDYSPVK
ncbi:MAG: NIPSNAP family protein [Luteolibacter sp.]